MKRFAALAALLLSVGCSSSGTQLAPGPASAEHVLASAPSDGRYAGTVFVSDSISNTVWICPANFDNIKDGYIAPSGQLEGIENPSQLAIDAHGTLYVANAQTDATGAGEIAEYSRGSSSPSRTLTSGLNTTTGVAVDSRGTVYASNKFAGTVAVFPKGSSSPSKLLRGKLAGPDGLAVDSADNLFIADSSANDVFEVVRGTTTPRSLGLRGIERPIGVAVDSKNDLYVSNLLGAVSTVTVYAPGATKPKETLVVHGPLFNSEQTIAEPAMLSITKPGDILIVSAPVTLALIDGEEYFGGSPITVAFAPGATTPLWNNTATTGTDVIFLARK